jgi:hypothetical protein
LNDDKIELALGRDPSFHDGLALKLTRPEFKGSEPTTLDCQVRTNLANLPLNENWSLKSGVVKGITVATLVTIDEALAYLLAPRISIRRILSPSTVSLSSGWGNLQVAHFQSKPGCRHRD